MRSNNELIDMRDALIQREIYPLYIMFKEKPYSRYGSASAFFLISSYAYYTYGLTDIHTERPHSYGVTAAEIQH
jgi:hypothetical protein